MKRRTILAAAGGVAGMMCLLMVLFLGTFHAGLLHGRRLQLGEDNTYLKSLIQEAPGGVRWVVTSRDTVEPGLEVLTIEDYIWHTVTLYVVAQGDTVWASPLER